MIDTMESVLESVEVLERKLGLHFLVFKSTNQTFVILSSSKSVENILYVFSGIEGAEVELIWPARELEMFSDVSRINAKDMWKSLVGPINYINRGFSVYKKKSCGTFEKYTDIPSFSCTSELKMKLDIC